MQERRRRCCRRARCRRRRCESRNCTQCTQCNDNEGADRRWRGHDPDHCRRSRGRGRRVARTPESGKGTGSGRIANDDLSCGRPIRQSYIGLPSPSPQPQAGGRMRIHRLRSSRRARAGVTSRSTRAWFDASLSCLKSRRHATPPARAGRVKLKKRAGKLKGGKPAMFLYSCPGQNLRKDTGVGMTACLLSYFPRGSCNADAPA